MTENDEIVHFGWPRSAPIDKTKSKFLNKLYWKSLEIFTISSMNIYELYHGISYSKSLRNHTSTASIRFQDDTLRDFHRTVHQTFADALWPGDLVRQCSGDEVLSFKMRENCFAIHFQFLEKLRLSISEPVSESVSLYSEHEHRIWKSSWVSSVASLFLSRSLCPSPLSSMGRSEESQAPSKGSSWSLLQQGTCQNLWSPRSWSFEPQNMEMGTAILQFVLIMYDIVYWK